MVANFATVTLVSFQESNGVVTIARMKPYGWASHTNSPPHGEPERSTPNVQKRKGGLDAKRIPILSGERRKMSLDIPFYRTFDWGVTSKPLTIAADAAYALLVSLYMGIQLSFAV
jgi:hypothetical protein